MKKYLSILLALVLVIGTAALAGCSKKGGSTDVEDPGVTVKEDAVDVPDSYEQISFDNSFYGLRFSSALPKYEKFEADEQSNGYYIYKGFTNEAEYHYYNVRVNTDVTTDRLREDAYNNSSGTTEQIEINGAETCKHTRDNTSSGKEINYSVFLPFMDGFAELDINVSYSNEDLTEEQWNELIDAIEKYSSFEILDTNKLTQNGKVVDSSGTMAFTTPSTIAGQTVELTQTLRPRNMYIEGSFNADGIPYKIYAMGNVTEAVYTARKENTEDYTEITSSDYTFYAYMINRFPNVECELYTEIGGIYYEFYIYRNHDLDVDSNKAFVADTGNYQIFADIAADLINSAEINAENLR